MVRKRVLRRVPGCYIELQISNKKLKHKAMLQKRTELMLNTQMYESMRWSCTKVVLFGNTVGKGLGKMGGGGIIVLLHMCRQRQKAHLQNGLA